MNQEFEPIDWDNFNRYNFETVSEARKELEENFDSRNAKEIFEELVEREKNSEELAEKVDCSRSNVRAIVFSMKEYGLTYPAGTLNERHYGLSISEIQDENYRFNQINK